MRSTRRASIPDTRIGIARYAFLLVGCTEGELCWRERIPPNDEVKVWLC